MSRWEPNARQTKSTFWYFPDKREVLFTGQDELGQPLAAGIAAAPEAATPLAMITSALEAATATFTPEQRELGSRLETVTATHPEPTERAGSKRASLAAATTAALRERGVTNPTATLAADLGVRAFYSAFARWADTTGPDTFTEPAHQELHELHTAAAALN